MNGNESLNFNRRINLNTDLKNISIKICEKYNLGMFISNELIPIGYEDYTFSLVSSKGKYCVKIFNKDKTEKEINGYLDRIKTVAKSNVNSPKPLFFNDDVIFYLEYNNNSYRISVFQFVEGKSFFELGIKPSKDDIKEIVHQTSMINKLNLDSDFVYDSWSVINFVEEYNKKRKYLLDEETKVFDKLLLKFKEIDFNKLPKSFVHGDIICTNVMVDKNSKIWIIDYSVSNYLPRIIDLAILACNICLDINSKENTYENISLLLKEYDKYNKLTDYELDNFVMFYKLTNAMHIIQTEYVRKAKVDTAENQYWLNEGKIGMLFSEDSRFYEVLKNLKN